MTDPKGPPVDETPYQQGLPAEEPEDDREETEVVYTEDGRDNV